MLSSHINYLYFQIEQKVGELKVEHNILIFNIGKGKELYQQSI